MPLRAQTIPAISPANNPWRGSKCWQAKDHSSVFSNTWPDQQTSLEDRRSLCPLSCYQANYLWLGQTWKADALQNPVESLFPVCRYSAAFKSWFAEINAGISSFQQPVFKDYFISPKQNRRTWKGELGSVSCSIPIKRY